MISKKLIITAFVLTAALAVFLPGCFSGDGGTSFLRIENSSGSSFSIIVDDFNYGTLIDGGVTDYNEFDADRLLPITIDGTATGKSIVLISNRYSTLIIYDSAFSDADDFSIGED